MFFRFIHFLSRVVVYTITLGGTSVAGFFLLLLLPPVISGIQTAWDQVNRGASWAGAIRETRPRSLFKKPVVIIWLCLLLWSIGAVTYADHMYLVDANGRHLSHLDESHPKLEAKIQDLMVAKTKRGETVLTVVLFVVNHGSPSIAVPGDVYVFLPGGRRILAKPMIPPEDRFILPGAPGTTSIVLDRSNYFPEKAAAIPIPKGGAAVGWVMFTVPGTSQEEMDEGADVVFHGYDIDKQEFIAERRFVHTSPAER
jgi:hypothetical protein